MQVKVFIPFTIGGGIRTVEDMRKMLKAGADKVSMNTAAIKDPSIIKEGAEKNLAINVSCLL